MVQIVPLVFFVLLSANASAFVGGGVPSHVQEVLRETQQFSQTCPQARLAPGKMIAINDYSGQTQPPKMYIFDQSGQLQLEVPITWGVGKPPSNEMSACSTGATHKTPPGLHLTARHDGATYNSSNSLGLAALSGQRSLAERKILIHGADNPGTASSWGCTGVPHDKLQEVMQKLGYGSLVNNYFGKPAKTNCGTQVGVEPTCQPEPAAIQASAGAGFGTGLGGRGSGGGRATVPSRATGQQ